MQLNLNPLGAFALLGRPLHGLANRTVALEDLLGPEGARLGDRIGAAATWPQRFALFEAALRERLARAKPASEAIAWAWRRLESSHGRVRIGSLADTIGVAASTWSRSCEQLGLPPKTVARVLRSSGRAACCAGRTKPATSRSPAATTTSRTSPASSRAAGATPAARAPVTFVQSAVLRGGRLGR
jgi:hypothetical protein